LPRSCTLGSLPSKQAASPILAAGYFMFEEA
jgi:hypothetical protein